MKAKIKTGAHAGHVAFVPRIALTTTKDCHSPVHTHQETVINKTVLWHDHKQVTRSNFDKSWNLSTTVSFHSWSVVCGYVKS